MTNGDPFEMFDGAYVLGALSEEDRRAYESHLHECGACAVSARELQGLPTLLAAVPASALADDPPPASLLPALQRRARRERRRRQWVVGGLAAAAAACILALVVAVVGPDHPSRHPVAMHAVGKAPIHATADVRAVGWGTRIDVVCGYYEAVTTPRPYALIIVPRHGEPQRLGTWNLIPGQEMNYQSGTSLHRDQIAAIEITSVETGQPLLTLNL